jgi:hypothetical protein
MTDRQDPEEPPGAVSNQNNEEGEAPHEDGEYGLRRMRPVPNDSGDGQTDDDEGAAGEGSQSTGHPESAG